MVTITGARRLDLSRPGRFGVPILLPFFLEISPIFVCQGPEFPLLRELTLYVLYKHAEFNFLGASF
jgi:hypothetical protein